MATKRGYVNLWDVKVDSERFEWLGKSANTSMQYRKNWNSNYKNNKEDDAIWYTIKWWWIWPLQWRGDYFIKKPKWQQVRTAIDSDGVITEIPDIFYYYTKDGNLKSFNNWDSIRKRAVAYWNNTKNINADINTAEANNINREWWAWLTKELDKKTQEFVDKMQGMISRAEAREHVRPEVVAAYVYPYKDAKWNNLRTAPQSWTQQRGRTIKQAIPPIRHFK